MEGSAAMVTSSPSLSSSITSDRILFMANLTFLNFGFDMVTRLSLT